MGWIGRYSSLTYALETFGAVRDDDGVWVWATEHGTLREFAGQLELKESK